MRVSLGIHKEDIEEALRTYENMSKKYFRKLKLTNNVKFKKVNRNRGKLCFRNSKLQNRELRQGKATFVLGCREFTCHSARTFSLRLHTLSQKLRLAAFAIQGGQ